MMTYLYYLLAYLIGSIPFGLVVTRLAGLGDIRKIGSGNIGATNVLRTGSKKLAVLTLLLDGGKGLAAVLIVKYLIAPYILAANAYTDCVAGPCFTYEKDVIPLAAAVGFFALLGHVFPVWLKFKGGKGVATILGVALAFNFWIGLGACLTWLIMAFTLRYSSLSALVAVTTLPGFAWYLGQPEYIPALALMAALVIKRHHENIQRLVAGTEPKIGKKK